MGGQKRHEVCARGEQQEMCFCATLIGNGNVEHFGCHLQLSNLIKRIHIVWLSSFRFWIVKTRAKLIIDKLIIDSGLKMCIGTYTQYFQSLYFTTYTY